jgi:hypothetical protein
MAIAEKLTYLNETKKQIKSALQSKGISVSDSDTFRSYAQKISDIQVGGESKLPQVIDRTVREITADDLAGITAIGEYAFRGCRLLSSVEFPSTITEIGHSAFYQCTNITSLTLPTNLTKIGDYGFYNLPDITSIKLPKTMTSIGHYAFNGCDNLTFFTCLATTPPTLGSSAIPSSVSKIKVPSSSVSTYRNATNWSAYANKIVSV